MSKDTNTSWETISENYNKTVGEAGSYYHQNVILPKMLQILDLRPSDAVLDLACGQGVFERALPVACDYMGIDLSESLITEATKLKKDPKHKFIVGDVTKPLNITGYAFTTATMILALQNTRDIHGVFANAYKYLKPGGQFFIVINHPSFRIPRHSMWEEDSLNSVSYRKVNRYMSNLEIPIFAEPSKHNASKTTLSFHYPLSFISEKLEKTGFMIQKIEEWVSDKESRGRNAKMENTARREFPLFMGILARKI